MITKDQPKCFPNNLKVALSSKSDGTVLNKSLGVHNPEIVKNRQVFCEKVGISYENVACQRIIYSENQTYNLICEVDEGSTIKNTPEVVADALFTKSKNVALFLPVADCIATVIFDPKKEILALLHLGRHSTLTNLLERVLNKFKSEGSDTKDLIVWMSPNAHAKSYIMEYFTEENNPLWRDFIATSKKGIHIDMQGFNASICQKASIKSENIHISEIDTVVSDDYFSHSAGDTNGRFGVIAMIK